MSPEQKLYERAFEIIEAYGADRARWPEQERSAIEQAIVKNPKLQAHLQVHAALDASLKSLEVRPRLSPEIVAQQIVAHPQRITRAQWLQLQLEGLTEWIAAAFWKPVFAASFVFLIGVGAGTVALEPVEDWSQAEHLSFALIGEEQ
jgi:hypothetical protein